MGKFCSWSEGASLEGCGVVISEVRSKCQGRRTFDQAVANDRCAPEGSEDY